MFVFMQLFNQINARKIKDGELNVFAGFFNNCMFLFITVFTFIVQMTMVEFGGRAVKTQPLNASQNLICLYIGSIELIWGLLIKMVPVHYCNWIHMSDEAASEEEAEVKSSKIGFKKSFTQR